MSAWAQAIWIVKQLQNQLKEQGMVEEYTEKLNSLTINLNDLKNELKNKDNQLEQLNKRFIPIITTDSNSDGKPDGVSLDFTQDQLWFITEGE